MEQMVLALDQAIADAQTAEPICHPAFDGALLTQSGLRYTYQFTVRTPWEPEENSRIYVEIDKQTEQRLLARVVSLDGTTLMLTTRAPIPPSLLAKVMLIEDTVWLLELQRSVLQDYLEGYLLAATGDFASKVLALAPARYGTRKVEARLGRLKFIPDAHQQQAIEHGLGSELTFIIGPGGTGKSAIEALLGNHFLKEDLSILAVSHTNIATDNMFLRLVQVAEESGDADLLHLFHDKRLVRLGEPRHRSLRTGAYHHLTVNAIADARLAELILTQQRIEEAQDVLASRTERLTQRFQQEDERWQGEREQLASAIAELQETLAELEWCEQQRIASLDRELKDQREKRASAEKQLARLRAYQVDLEGQLCSWQGDLFRQTPTGNRGRCQAQLEAAKQELARLQNRGRLRRLLAGEQHERDVAAAIKEIAARQKDLDEADWTITEHTVSLQHNYQEQIGLHEALEKASAEIKRVQAAFSSSYWTDQMRPYRNNLESLLTTMQEGENASAERAEELEAMKREKRETDTLLKELEAQMATMKQQIVAEARLVATTITGVYLNGDLLRRQFDVVLVDEISMISVIAALLVALRATRRFIAGGDPMQFLPILKTVCSERERAEKMPEALTWLARDLLSYRGVTIFDAITGEKGCVLLVQQGRMHPKILAPINQYVYQNTLVSRPETEDAPPIAPLPQAPLMLVDSSASPESCTRKPSKNESRINEHHVKVVVALVPHVLASLPARSATEDTSVPRIGVLAPYRSQAKRLLRALREAGLDEQVHVGTINTAQALQFEVVILDTVEAPGLVPFRFTMDSILDERDMATDATRRWNVGHTRARHKLIYIAHLDHLCRHQPRNPKKDSAKQCLLVELANWAAREGSLTSQEVVEGSLI